MTPELGIIEGYFGRAWSWADRAEVVSTLAPAGYRFFHYAPKIDSKLRRDWQTLHDASESEALHHFAQHCRDLNVRFGIGLSPYGAHVEFDNIAKSALKAKMAHLNSIGIDDLAILFDDMRGDFADLASRQAEIVAFAVEYSSASRFFMCPSYYSDDRFSIAYSAPARPAIWKRSASCSTRKSEFTGRAKKCARVNIALAILLMLPGV